MIIIDSNRQAVGELASNIAHLESLIADLERFSNGEFPSKQALEAAPLIESYALALRPSLCMVGGNAGHPYRKGRAIRTSELWIFAPELGWARTYSRLYRLGQPMFLDQQPTCWEHGR